MTVPAKTDQRRVRRTVSMWAKCGLGNSRWGGYTDVYNNSKVVVHVDGKPSPVWYNGNRKMKGKHMHLLPGGNFGNDFYIKLPEDNHDHHIMFVHEVVDFARESRVDMHWIAKGAELWVERCLEGKACLSVFGDGKKGGFTFRNNNAKHRNCLNGRPEEQDQERCGLWKACMKKREVPGKPAYMDILQNLLNAMAPPASFAELQRRQVVAKEDKDCMDPGLADPESLECECWTAIQSQCEKAGQQEACFRKHLCKHPKVSCTWKQTNCGQHNQKNCCKGPGDLALMQDASCRDSFQWLSIVLVFLMVLIVLV